LNIEEIRKLGKYRVREGDALREEKLCSGIDLKLIDEWFDFNGRDEGGKIGNLRIAWIFFLRNVWWIFFCGGLGLVGRFFVEFFIAFFSWLLFYCLVKIIVQVVKNLQMNLLFTNCHLLCNQFYVQPNAATANYF
jgi:hypothetical protein